MTFLQRLLRALGYYRPRILSFKMEEELLQTLEDISQQEKRSTEDVAADLLAQGLERREGAEQKLELWESLSPREKQVTACVCLGYTNPQIAAHLGVSTETVRTHLSNIRAKFRVRSKNEIRMILADWDFTAWEE